MKNLFVCLSLFFAQLSFGNTSPNIEYLSDIETKSPINYSSNHDCGCYTLGSASFTGGSTNSYTIDPPAYPATTLLSRNRTDGFKQGKIRLTPTGLTINEPGNYLVNFSAVVYNNDVARSIVLPVFLSATNPNSTQPTTVLGATETLDTNSIRTIQGSGILPNVCPETALSILASNGGTPGSHPLTIFSWNINATRICECE